MAAGAISFAELVERAPHIAEPIGGRLRAAGIGILGTVRRDGAPRVSPVEVMLLDDGRLTIGMMVGSHKLADVVRDPRVSLLTALADRHDLGGEGKLTGRLDRLPDHDARAVLLGVGFEPDQLADAPVLELRITAASWQRVVDDQFLTDVWDVDGGERRFRRVGVDGLREPI